MGAMYHHVRRDICGEDGEMLIPMVVIWLRLFGANRDAEPIAELGEIARKTNQATHIHVFTYSRRFRWLTATLLAPTESKGVLRALRALHAQLRGPYAAFPSSE